MNPILFEFGPIEIRWYAFLILIAVIIGISLFMKEGKRFNISSDFLFNLAFWVIVFGILGARLYYVIFNWSEYSSDLLSIFKIWNGGLAIHGGIIAGFITMYVYCRKYNVSVFKIADMAVVPVILGQAIGRWGNFFNGEAHGGIVSLAFLEKLHLPQFIIDGMYINGNYYHPTFLYESFFNLICFIILLFLRRSKKIKDGMLLSIYLIWYGIVRFFIEGLRTDSLMLGSIRIAQLVSISLIVIGIILLIKSKNNKVYNEVK